MVDSDERRQAEPDRSGALGRGVTVANEFAAVEVRVVSTTHGAFRLVIRDLHSGSRRELDPLILETLARLSEVQMEGLAAPDLIAGGAGEYSPTDGDHRR